MFKEERRGIKTLFTGHLKMKEHDIEGKMNETDDMSLCVSTVLKVNIKKEI